MKKRFSSSQWSSETNYAMQKALLCCAPRSNKFRPLQPATHKWLLGELATTEGCDISSPTGFFISNPGATLLSVTRFIMSNPGATLFLSHFLQATPFDTFFCHTFFISNPVATPFSFTHFFKQPSLKQGLVFLNPGEGGGLDPIFQNSQNFRNPPPLKFWKNS